MTAGGSGLGSWFPWSDEMRAARAEEEAMYRYDDGMSLRDRVEDNEWVARVRFGWELATLAPRMVFTSLAAFLMLFAGVGLVLVGLVYVALAVWATRPDGCCAAPGGWVRGSRLRSGWWSRWRWAQRMRCWRS